MIVVHAMDKRKWKWYTLNAPFLSYVCDSSDADA